MKPREGMARLRAERKQYGLCTRCGMLLPKGYGKFNCPACLKRVQELSARRAKEMKQHEQTNGCI